MYFFADLCYNMLETSKKAARMKKNEKKETAKTPKKAKSTRPRTSPHRYPVSECADDAARFLDVIYLWSGLARKEATGEGPLIGVLGEKSLHSILKRFITEDESAYEVPIRTRDGEVIHKYVADVCTENKIFEIQTGGFYPLIPKLSYYLSETDYDVTVVHPIPMIRYKSWIDPKSGELKSRTRSPKKGRAEDALRELFWIREYLSSPRLHVTLLFLEEEEYRFLDGWSYDKKRGSNRCERVPVSLLGRVDLMSREDYRAFLPPELPLEFVASELGTLLGLRGRAVYSALRVFLSLGFFEEIGTRGRSVLYRRTDGSSDSSDGDTLL